MISSSKEVTWYSRCSGVIAMPTSREDMIIESAEKEMDILRAEITRLGFELKAEQARHEAHSNLNGELSTQIEGLKAEIGWLKEFHSEI
jgi:hypothetical protein